MLANDISELTNKPEQLNKSSQKPTQKNYQLQCNTHSIITDGANNGYYTYTIQWMHPVQYTGTGNGYNYCVCSAAGFR